MIRKTVLVSLLVLFTSGILSILMSKDVLYEQQLVTQKIESIDLKNIDHIKIDNSRDNYIIVPDKRLSHSIEIYTTKLWMDKVQQLGIEEKGYTYHNGVLDFDKNKNISLVTYESMPFITHLKYDKAALDRLNRGTHLIQSKYIIHIPVDLVIE